MNRDSSVTDLDYLPIFPENYTDTTDFVVKLLSFEENHANEVYQLYDAGKNGIELGTYQFYCFNQCEKISKFKFTNSDIQPSDNDKSPKGNEDMHHTKNNDLNMVKKMRELMQAKTEKYDLQEKVKLCEKEKADLLLKLEMLQAQNYQFAHLKKHRNEIQSSVRELKKDLSNQLKIQQTMRMEVEGYKKQLSRKNKTMKKLETCNRKLRNIGMQLVQKLKEADLLTVEEKNIIEKFEDGNLENTLDSEDEEISDSSILNSNSLTKHNTDSVVNKSDYHQTYGHNESKHNCFSSMDSFKKLSFSHQQLKEFETGPVYSTLQRNLNASYSNHSDLNIGSLSSPSRKPYKFSAKWCHNGTVKLSFQIENPISMKVNPNNWEVSCVLEPHLRGSDVTPESNLKPIHLKPCVKGHNSMFASENTEPIVREISKVEEKSSKITVQKSFEPSKKQSAFKPSIFHPDVSSNNNSSYKQMKIKKYSENTPHPQQFENVVNNYTSFSLKKLSPHKKCVDVSLPEFLLPLNNSASEVESKELDDPSNFMIKSSGNKDISVKMLNDTLTDDKCSEYNSSINNNGKKENSAHFSKLGASMHTLGEKNNKSLQKEACFYKNSPISNFKKMSESVLLQENGSLDKRFNSSENNTSCSFQASCAVSSSIDPSVHSSLEPVVSEVGSIINTLIDSATASVESEMETESLSRRCRKRQESEINSSYLINKTKKKKGLKNVILNMANESKLIVSDSNKISEEILKIDPDIKFSDDSVSEIKNAKEINVKPKNNIPNKTPMIKMETESAKVPKKSGDETEISLIENAFKAIDKIKPTAADFELYVEKLVADFSDESISQSSQNLIFHLVKYLHNAKKKPMYSYFISNNPDTLLPISERYIVKLLLTLDAKNNPHLSGLLHSTITTMYYLILGKMQYHIYGLSSLCRVMAALCKELNDPSTPRHLCSDLLKYNHKFGPFLIASIVGVYKEAFEVLPYTPEDEKIFIHALSHGIQPKPETLKDALWNHSCKVISKYLTFENTNISRERSYLKKAIKEKCLCGLKEDDQLLIGPLVIYARVKGWNWAQKHLLEGYVKPNLILFASKEDGERGFSFFTDLCADICYGCPDEDLSQSWLIDFLLTPCEREFVQICAGTALIKLILLRKELFPDKIKEWLSCNYEDPRVIAVCNLHFKLRLMENHDLDFASDIF